MLRHDVALPLTYNEGWPAAGATALARSAATRIRAGHAPHKRDALETCIASTSNVADAAELTRYCLAVPCAFCVLTTGSRAPRKRTGTAPACDPASHSRSAATTPCSAGDAQQSGPHTQRVTLSAMGARRPALPALRVESKRVHAVVELCQRCARNSSGVIRPTHLDLQLCANCAK